MSPTLRLSLCRSEAPLRAATGKSFATIKFSHLQTVMTEVSWRGVPDARKGTEPAGAFSAVLRTV